MRGTAYGKVGHVGDEGVHLDDLGKRRASLLKDGLEVLNALPGLLLDRAGDEVALGVAGDLARAVDGGGGLDGLGLERRWRVLVRDGNSYPSGSQFSKTKGQHT